MITDVCETVKTAAMPDLEGSSGHQAAPRTSRWATTGCYLPLGSRFHTWLSPLEVVMIGDGTRPNVKGEQPWTRYDPRGLLPGRELVLSGSDGQ